MKSYKKHIITRVTDIGQLNTGCCLIPHLDVRSYMFN